MTTTFSFTRLRRLGALCVAACCGAALPAPAAPTQPQVVAGQASFSQQGNVFSIVNTPGTIINWQSFGVGAGEVTRFLQQSADSAVLNRVLGQDPSKILGALQSNGKVFLINPNGILFGQGARVDVNGLVASTLDIADADFLAGKNNFQARAGTDTGVAGVRNQGTIATPSGGGVFLLAPNVENDGIVSAPNGQVVLAAGHSVQLADANDPALHVVIAAPADRALNLGQLIAQGGRIGILGALVNQRGLVSADSAVRGADGKILLKASRATLLGAGSVTSALGSGSAGGGAISVLGPQVTLAGGARVDASGVAGGGTVLVGGDWQGAAGTPRAQQLTMAAGAIVRADATGAGNGGKVVLWSDGTTVAHGAISAQGGGSGSGGQVETSGHVLDVDGIAVDARGGTGAGSGAGAHGSWLLDPYDIEVVAGGSAAAGDVASASAGAASGVTRIAPATLTAAGADVVLQAQHDLTITDPIAAAGNVSAQAGHDIVVDALVGSSGGSLDFRAGNGFALGANGVLKTANYIDVRANTVTLAGAIAGNGGQLPVLSFSSTDPGRAITVGSGTPDANALWLDGAALARLSANAYEINLGNSQQAGAVTIATSLALSSNLVMESSSRVALGGAVDLSANPDSRFVATVYGAAGLIEVDGALNTAQSVLLQGDHIAIGAPLTSASVSLMPNDAASAISIGGSSSGNGSGSGSGAGLWLGQAALGQVRAGQLTIGGMEGAYGGITVAGAVDLSGAGGPARVVLDAGAGALALRAPLAVGGTLVLDAGALVAETDAGAIAAPALAVRGGSVALTGANGIGTLAASSDGSGPFQVANNGALTLGTVDGLSGIAAHGAALQLALGGSLDVGAGIQGAASADLAAAGIGGGGVVQAGTLTLRSSAGIGSAGAPLKTQAGTLTASNQDSGSQPIAIANQGTLVLAGALQSGDGNRGAIAIDNVGGLTVPAYVASDANASGEVRTGSGDISLTTHSPLTILGRVMSDSGNLRLLADNGGALTIAAGASVGSGTGKVSITAGSTSIAAGSVHVASPDQLQVSDASAQTGTPGTPSPPAAPTLAACLAAPSATGCAAVLAQALQTCSANPDGALCNQVLPSVATCQVAPSTAGCGVVLARNAVDQCLANSALPDCAAKVPTYATCQSAPSDYGCTQVIQRHDAVGVCIANPDAAGCAQTLPALAACRADATIYGCVPVLARADFDACLANPGAAGCLATLPPLAQCKLTRALEGCSQVLQLAFQACLANPHDASCGGVLPTLGACETAPATAGCEVVLPTLAQCTGSPSLQGCEVRLPTLAQCAGAPAQAGCEAVLPSAPFCSSHPGDASCVVFSGGGGGNDPQGAPVAQALQGTVHLIDAGTAQVAPPAPGQPGDAQGGRDRAPGGGEHDPGPAPGPAGPKGDKPAIKNYCN